MLNSYVRICIIYTIYKSNYSANGIRKHVYTNRFETYIIPKMYRIVALSLFVASSFNLFYISVTPRNLKGVNRIFRAIGASVDQAWRFAERPGCLLCIYLSMNFSHYRFFISLLSLPSNGLLGLTFLNIRFCRLRRQ